MDESQQIESDVPCVVCGKNILYLESGYHFCLECGTQRDDYQEQMVEYNEDIDQKKLGKQKIHKEKKDDSAPKMSSFRMNLHSLNYILIGLTEELIAAGASPDLKNAVLQLWIKLLQKENIAFHTKDDEKFELQFERKRRKLSTEGSLLAKSIKINNESPAAAEENLVEPLESLDKDEAVISADEDSDHLFGKANITRHTLYAILYLALNTIGDDIQLSDLLRFARENRISFASIKHFLPSDIKFTYMCFLHNNYEYPSKRHLILQTEKLAVKLGISQLKPPDLRKLTSRYILELQLPELFNFCVNRLLTELPPDFEAAIVPNYEAKAMSYIVVVLKIFFYLDDYTENILSDFAKNKNDSSKSKHRNLFVWRDWTKFIEYRKIFIAKHYFPMMRSTDQNNMDEDAFISHHLNNSKEPDSADHKDHLSGQLIDDMLTLLLSKHTESELADDFQCHTFPPSLTPNTTNLTIILNGNFDQNFQKHLLIENFRIQKINYLFERSQFNLLNSEKDAIKNIAKSYRRPIFLFDSYDSKFLEAKHIYAHTLNRKTVYAFGCSEDLHWNSEDAQKLLYKRFTQLETKIFTNEIDELADPIASLKIVQNKTKRKAKVQRDDDGGVTIRAQNEMKIKKLFPSADLTKVKRGFQYLYWTKHYRLHYLQRVTVFEKELENRFPESFAWLLHECSTILEEHSMYLYREVVKVEQMLITFTKKNNCVKKYN